MISFISVYDAQTGLYVRESLHNVPNGRFMVPPGEGVLGGSAPWVDLSGLRLDDGGQAAAAASAGADEAAKELLPGCEDVLDTHA
jgi:hypothetical protein